MLNIDKYDYDNSRSYNQVYCFVEFMKPGRQTYVTCLPEESDDCVDNDMTYFTHRTIINVRDEDVPIFVKAEKSHINVRSFNKDNSVFREWK